MWMSAALDSLKLGPGDLLVFVPWTIPQASYHLWFIWVFLTVAALRINWAGVICARVVWSRFFEAVSITSAKINFLNSRTPISARFGHGVCGLVAISSRCEFGRPASREDDGKPYLHKLPSGSSGTCPSTHEA